MLTVSANLYFFVIFYNNWCDFVFVFAEKGKYWSCIGRTTFKNLPVKSLSFSIDGSLLSVGFGNTLCVYQPDSLRLRCVLSCPAGLDGTANKITIDLPESSSDDTITPVKSKSEKKPATPSNDRRAQIQDRRRKLLHVVKSFLETGDKELVKNINNKLGQMLKTRPQNPMGHSLSLKEQEYVHRKVMTNTELNLYQKIQIFDKLSLRTKGPANMKAPFEEYVHRNFSPLVEFRKHNALRQAAQLSHRHRFEFSRKIYNYTKRLSSRRSPMHGCNLFRFVDDDAHMANGNGLDKTIQINGNSDFKIPTKNPVQKVAQIEHVAFGHGENAHLVIVCTERRLLIWNLLTLRLQTAIKLSVHRLTVDPYTSLVAAFTINNERELDSLVLCLCIDVIVSSNLSSLRVPAVFPISVISA